MQWHRELKNKLSSPVQGLCNICGEESTLTFDHVPPKGCVRVGQMERRHITEKLSVDAKPLPGKRAPDGVKFRTLCHRCNGDRLGAKYDPALRQLVNSVTARLQSRLYLPDVLDIEVQPQKIMRAVLGHLSAQGDKRYSKGPNTEAFRDYFLDESLPLPAGIKIYYWVYPFYPQVLIKDCAYLDLSTEKPVSIWLMKFFPMAFLVSWQDKLPQRFGLPSFDPWRNAAINDNVSLPINLRPIIHPDWPENPTDNAVLLYGQEAMVANRRELME